jgi:transaldolase
VITEEIAAAGTSIWLDDLSRSKLTDNDPHSLPNRIAHDGVVGVTTNPSIFGAAISTGADYRADISAMKGQTTIDIVKKLTTDDVRSACDLFAPIYLASSGVDGRVSIEVDPRSAKETEVTISQGEELWRIVDRPNVLIKVPATLEGLPAITDLISRGISVNVTLIFSIPRYIQVMDAYINGLEKRLASGDDISHITSVASFFVSRIDTAVDALLKSNGSPQATALLGKAAIANARLIYEAFEMKMKSPRWTNLASHGARLQRPLWASTGVKDPAYVDTRYVLELIAPHTVNTMPQATLDAVIDHGHFHDVNIASTYEDSRAVFTALAALGIDISSVADDLEREGVAKFSDAWKELLHNVEGAMGR